MSYNKEARNEEMETELREDKIRELKNEFDDGDFETWKGDNEKDLLAGFIGEYQEEWEDYCKESWREHNGRLR